MCVEEDKLHRNSEIKQEEYRNWEKEMISMLRREISGIQLTDKLRKKKVLENTDKGRKNSDKWKRTQITLLRKIG